MCAFGRACMRACVRDGCESPSMGAGSIASVGSQNKQQVNSGSPPTIVFCFYYVCYPLPLCRELRSPGPRITGSCESPAVGAED